MKKLFIYFLVSFFLTNNSFAISLSEALLEAYKKNPKLNAERENLEIAKEKIKESKSDFFPTITISGYMSDENNTQTSNAGVETNPDISPIQKRILIEQILYEGKGRNASLKKENIGYEIAKLNLKKVEQEILFEAVEVYSSLVLSNKKIKINKDNIDLIERQVETDKNRLERGEINITDLAQTEASLSGARAKLIDAESQLTISKLNFEKIIGSIENYKNLTNLESFTYSIPSSLIAANQISKKEDPNLNIAILKLEEAKQDVLIARSELNPTATLSFDIKNTQDVSTTVNEKDQRILKAEASWPIFTGGKNSASLRKSKRLENQKILLLEDATRSNEASVATAWSNYQSSKSFLNSIKSQVKAAEIANEGITIEYEAGLGRSTLDVIQSNSILLDAKINLANSERNFLLSQYKLLFALGSLSASNLGIK